MVSKLKKYTRPIEPTYKCQRVLLDGKMYEKVIYNAFRSAKDKKSKGFIKVHGTLVPVVRVTCTAVWIQDIEREVRC